MITVRLLLKVKIIICQKYLSKTLGTECNFEVGVMNATSSAIALPFRNILFACDEEFQRKLYETSVLLLH